MRAKQFPQAGFGHIVLLMLVLVVAVIGFAGYKVASTGTAKTASAPSTSATAVSTIPASIDTAADLAQTGKALDSSATQAESSLDDSGLDADIDAVL